MMSCNCIEEKIKEVKDIISNQESVAEIVEEPKVREMSFYTQNWKLGQGMFIHIDAKYRLKKKDGTSMKNTATDTLSIMIKFCPMCGAKFKGNESGNNPA